MATVNLDKQLEYMYGLERFGIKLGLEVMEALLAKHDNPHQKFPSVHITGTTGKGSVAAMLESVLRHQGYKTALYISPHLFRFNERIRVNNQDITNEELSLLIEKVRTAAEIAQVEPTFFEFTTAIAFLYFAERQPDIAIIEVGMGGLLDATNVITPLVSVITNIGLDHTFLLGKTREEIAVNKAGIIKPSVPSVTGEKDPAIVELLQANTNQKKSHLRRAQSEVEVTLLQQTYYNQSFRLKDPFLTLSVRKGLMSRLEGLEGTLPLVGDHQRDNVATAITVLDELAQCGFSIDPAAVMKGLAATTWAGRLEVISEKPFILVDGAHNPPSLQALVKFLTDPATKPPSYDVLVLGVKKDKDIGIIKEELALLFKHIITTEGSYQPMVAAELAQKLNAAEIIPDATAATKRGLELIGETGSLVITGSLYMIPAALRLLKEKNPGVSTGND